MPNISVPAEHLANPIGYAITNLAPDRTGAMYDFSTLVYRNSKLPLREFEGARARIAQINGCQLCQQFRSIDDVPTYLEGLGEDPEVGVHKNGPAPEEAFYLEIADWQRSEVYSPRERLAIEYAERFSTEPDALGHDGDFWTRLKAAFTEDEIVDLTLACAAFLAAGRFVHVLGFDEGAVCDIRSTAQAAE